MDNSFCSPLSSATRAKSNSHWVFPHPVDALARRSETTVERRARCACCVSRLTTCNQLWNSRERNDILTAGTGRALTRTGTLTHPRGMAHGQAATRYRFYVSRSPTLSANRSVRAADRRARTRVAQDRGALMRGLADCRDRKRGYGGIWPHARDAAANREHRPCRPTLAYRALPAHIFVHLGKDRGDNTVVHPTFETGGNGRAEPANSSGASLRAR
jgi:hypothetical protein